MSDEKKETKLSVEQAVLTSLQLISGVGKAHEEDLREIDRLRKENANLTEIVNTQRKLIASLENSKGAEDAPATD